MQSKEEFCIDSDVKIFIIVQPQFAGGRRTQHVMFSNIAEKIAAKRCVVQIQSRDSICMLRALVVAKAKIDEDPQYRHLCEPDNITTHRRNGQFIRARQLANSVGISQCGPHDLSDLAKIQQHLNTYRIIAVDAITDKIIFDGGFQRGGASRVLGLLHHNKHYHALVNVAAWYEGKRFCYGCCKRYEKPGQHRCKTTCDRCLGTAHEDVDPSNTEFPKKCLDCLRSFYTASCYERHKQPGTTTGTANSIREMLRICKQ